MLLNQFYIENTSIGDLVVSYPVPVHRFALLFDLFLVSLDLPPDCIQEILRAGFLSQPVEAVTTINLKAILWNLPCLRSIMLTAAERRIICYSMSHEVERTNTGWCKKNPSIFEFPPTNPRLLMHSPSALTELPSWTFEGNFSHFLYSKLIWEWHSTYLQIAFSQEFSLPVAKLVSSASEKAMDVADFAASPKTHTIAMMALASIL